MLRKSATLALAVGMAVAVWGQAPAARVTDRLEVLSRQLAKSPADVETLVGLAQFYFDNSNPMRSLPLASRYAAEAERCHSGLLRKDKTNELVRLQKRGISLGSIRQLRKAVADAAVQTVRTRTDMPPAEIDLYLEAFGSDDGLAKTLRARRLRQTFNHILAHGSEAEMYRFTTDYAGTDEAATMERELAALAEESMLGASSADAVDEIASRYPQSRLVAQAAVRRKSALAYAEAELDGSMRAYSDFLSLYPASDQSEAARGHMDRMAEADLAQRADAVSLIHFADSNSDSPLADRALAKLRKIIYRNHDVEAARYYVGHYPYDPHVNEVYSVYYSWYSEEGNATLLRAFADLNPGFVYPRALEDDLEKGEAIDTLPLVQPYADSLYLRYDGYVRELTGKAIAIVPLQRMLQSPLRQRNYQAAIELVKRFELVFDNKYSRHYNSLLHLLSTPGGNHRPVTVMADTIDVGHPCVNPADGMLYFTDGRLLLRASPKGKGWQRADTLRLLGAGGARLTLFGFYDNGRGMLLGCEGDIWMAERDGDAWRVSDIPPYPVNTDYLETDACMLPDGSGMLLASDRPGGYNLLPSGSNHHGDTAAATDIYFVPRTPQGWGTPVNLGLGVNSSYCERHPVISRNLRTLYFVSDAPGGLGYGDIYTCQRTDAASWTQWSTPRNLGREVNSPWREADLSLSPDESLLYYSTDDGGHRRHARCVATAHNSASGSAQLAVDLAEAAPTMVRMQVADLAGQTVTQTIDLTQADTLVPLRLDRGSRYVLMVDAGSSLVAAAVVQPGDAALHRLPAYTLDELVATDRALPLPAVACSGDGSELMPLADKQLSLLARFLLRNRECTVEIEVDTDRRDATKAYLESQRTAAAVKAALVKNGIDSRLVTLSPYGNARCRRGGAPGVSVRFRD